MDTPNAAHPVHDTRTWVAAQSTGTASLADALARATRLMADLNAAMIDDTMRTDPTAEALWNVLVDATLRAARQADIVGERYQGGWIAARRLTHEVDTVVRDLDAVSDLVRLTYRVAQLPVEALHVGTLADGLGRTLTMRAAQETRAARKAAAAAQ